MALLILRAGPTTLTFGQAWVASTVLACAKKSGILPGGAPLRKTSRTKSHNWPFSGGFMGREFKKKGGLCK